MQKYANLVDLVKSFPTSIYLQKSASIQPRTSLVKFARSPRTDPPGGEGEQASTTHPDESKRLPQRRTPFRNMANRAFGRREVTDAAELQREQNRELAAQVAAQHAEEVAESSRLRPSAAAS